MNLYGKAVGVLINQSYRDSLRQGLDTAAELITPRLLPNQFEVRFHQLTDPNGNRYADIFVISKFFLFALKRSILHSLNSLPIDDGK